jgi:hypothetical protein
MHLNANLFKYNCGNVNKCYMPTNRLTTAAMNILGLRIKKLRVLILKCSAMSYLDNNFGFMFYFLEKHVA